jgi:hypothetical protein
MCWFQGFNDGIVTAQWYEDTGGVLPLDPANGFFIAAVVGIAVVPSNFEVIARNGDVANEGWELRAVNSGVNPVTGNPLLSFDFRVYDGAVVTATVTAGPFEIAPEIEPQLGVSQILFRVFAWFDTPDGGAPNGTINIRAEDQTGLVGVGAALTNPYVNTTPFFRVGAATIVSTALTLPNCIHGIVGGDGIPAGATDATLAGPYLAWLASVKAESQIVAPLPDLGIPTLLSSNGWRANNPFLGPGDAPDPVIPFLGPVDLDFVFAAGGFRPPLTVACAQPSVFWIDTL